MTSTGKDDEEMASTVAAAAAAAVEATASSTTETMAAATTAAMGIMMMDPSMSTTTTLGDDDGDEEGVVAPGMESTGRWTKQEHNRFLQGIDKYGKEWKKVAAFVRTRTVMQTRTHAQKFYEKLSQVALRATGTPLPSKSTSSKPMAVGQYARPSGVASMVNAKKLPSVVPASFVHHGATSATMVVPPIPVVSFTELDILVPINDATASRPSNKIYMDMMKMNCFIFHSLPITEQLWFARNIVHFLSSVRRHRWIGCNYYGTAPQYQLLNEPVSVVQSDFRMDPLKVAAFAFHPLWLLGDHDIHKVHNGNPFIHRTVDGTWKHVTMSQVRDILNGEGPKNLLLLPPSIPAMESAAAIAIPVTTIPKAPPAPVETIASVTTKEDDTNVETTTGTKEDDEVHQQEEEVAADEDDEYLDTKETEAEIVMEEEADENPPATATVTKKTTSNKSKPLPMAATNNPSKRTTAGTTTRQAAAAAVEVEPPPNDEKQRRTKRSKI
jgi:SHAQKYF class myb-like DNA-binding protein